MARQRVLWDAIDSDRRRWIRASIVVLPFVFLTAFSVWVLVETGSPRAIEFVVRAVAPITAIVLFPVVRGWRIQSVYQQIGAIPVATGMAPTTKSALSDVSLAGGLGALPQLYLYTSDSYNAFIWRSAGVLRIAVSSAFSSLPEEEQRAGLAMLVGRTKVDVTAFAAEHELGSSSKKHPPAPENDPVLFRAWVDAAIAGDREGLELLMEPVPMICLLERLSTVSTAVPEFARDRGMHDACFNFLAWPYGRVWDVADVVKPGTLPARAEAAVEAVIAEEMTEGSPFSSGGANGMGNPQALRAQRLREVSGAEGAIAGSTSAAARVGLAAEQAAAPAAPSAPAPAPAPAATAPASAVAAPPLAGPAVAVAVAAPAAPASAAPASPAPPPPRSAPVAHIEVTCPACGADNAPGNRECIRCGEPMPRRS